ncbi:unnamed protein product [Withania somnifera]
MKKTFFYNFFPSKPEEEVCKVNNTPWVVTREAMEVNDIYPTLKINPQNPWQIKKEITYFEVFGEWNMMCVDVWNVTERNNPKKYEHGSVCFRKPCNDDFSLSIMGLFNDCGLGVGDKIEIY